MKAWRSFHFGGWWSVNLWLVVKEVKWNEIIAILSWHTFSTIFWSQQFTRILSRLVDFHWTKMKIMRILCMLNIFVCIWAHHNCLWRSSFLVIHSACPCIAQYQNNYACVISMAWMSGISVSGRAVIQRKISFQPFSIHASSCKLLLM